MLRRLSHCGGLVHFGSRAILDFQAELGNCLSDVPRSDTIASVVDAKIIENNQSAVAAEKILHTGLFDFEKAHEHPMWTKELYGFANHVPETEEYGVTSYLYRAFLPFIPVVLNVDLPCVIRTKGHFWISTRPNRVAEFSLVVALGSVKPFGTWWVTFPVERCPQHESARAYVQAHWQEPLDDSSQEIVLIGSGIDWSRFKARLYSCHVPATAALVPDNIPDYPDPFPVWRSVEDAA